MDHVAILRKGKILNNIVKGRKTIESRWYVNKISPWDKISKGDTVYFKESGEPVTVKAYASKVLQFDLINNDIGDIVRKYGKQIDPDSTKKSFLDWAKNLGKKRYVVLVFLKDVEKVEPFNINKKGYGISCAWLLVKDINNIKC